MRILHLTSHLQVGGVPRSVVWLACALQRRGHDVIVVSGGGRLDAEPSAQGVTHWYAPLHTSVEFSPRVFAAGRALARRLGREPVDILHAHTRVGQVVADRLSRRCGIPYVTTWHGFFHLNLGRRLWPCTGMLTIAISEPVRRHLIDTFRVPPARIRLIPHGVDAAQFLTPVAPAEQARWRQQLGLPAEGPVVGTMSRLVASKGVDQLIRSLPRIREVVPGARLVIIGDGPERRALERLAEGLGVAEAVRFAGTVPETRAILSVMDVFVFIPAVQEGFGLSLLEAMASSRPIVAIRRGDGASWVLDQGGIGAVVEPEDPAALAAEVVRFLRDRDAAQRAAGLAQTVVRERYTLDRVVEQVEAVYRDAVTGKSDCHFTPKSDCHF